MISTLATSTVHVSLTGLLVHIHPTTGPLRYFSISQQWLAWLDWR